MKRIVICVVCILCVFCLYGRGQNQEGSFGSVSDSTQNEKVSPTVLTSSDISEDPSDTSTYKLYYVVDSGIVGIVGFDDGISSFDISTMKDELKSSGYSV